MHRPRLSKIIILNDTWVYPFHKGNVKGYHTTFVAGLHTHGKPHGHNFDNKKDCPGLIQASMVFAAQVACRAPHCAPWSAS